MLSLEQEGLPAHIVAYHRRTKHQPTRYALGPAFLDWQSQPCPYRRFEGARLVELPLRDREPTAPFPGPASAVAPISARSLGLFFELAFGLSAWKSYEGSLWALRNNPSSGNLHPTEAYALLNAGDLGASAALFHYAPVEHALEERATFEAAQVLPAGGFLLGLSAVHWRESWKYGERAFRYCQLDAGHAIGAAAQAAAALGWRAQVLPEPGDDEVAVLLGLDRDDAWRRREEEHPDALLWIGAGPVPSIDVLALAQAPRRWQGAANRLSEDHDAWPAVDRAARLCHKPRGPAPAQGAERAPRAVRTAPEIGEVVRRRRSAQRMDGVAVLPREAFAAMLRATLPGVPPLLASFPWPARLTLLLFVHRVDGLDPGLYLLQRDAEAARRLAASSATDFAWAPVGLEDLDLFLLREGPCEREAAKFSCLQPIAGKGCFAVAMLADFDRALAEDGAFAYRRLHWEAGLTGQALYLEATAAGLSGTGIGCFFDDEVHALMGLAADQTQFQDVYHFTVGASVEDVRLISLPAYSDERRTRP